MLTPPFRVIDAVDPVLHLHHQASVLRNRPREALVAVQALRLLERQGAVLRVAAVHLEGRLVRVDVQVDARPGRREARDGAFGAPVKGLQGISVDDVAGILRFLVSPTFP